MKLAYGICLGALTGIFSVALGCGGIGDAENFFTDGAGGSGAAGSGGSKTTGASASTGGDTTTGSSSGRSSSSSGASSASSGESSSSSGSGNAALPCDSAMCPLGEGSACCWDRFKLHEGPQAECVMGSPDTDNCATEALMTGLESRIECRDKGQCDGQLCCAHRASFNGTQFSYFDLATCKASCELGELKLCDPATDAECPLITTPNGTTQTVCKPTDGRLPPGYFFCGFPN